MLYCICPILESNRTGTHKDIAKMVKKSYGKVDKNLQKVVENEEEEGSALLVSVRDGLITCSGSSNIVSFVEEEDLMSLTVHQLFHKINYEKSSNVFDVSTALWFPKLPTKFKGPGWNWSVAYKTLKLYFNILGFKKGGNQHFGNPQDKPSCFPDSISWESFKHPGSEKIERINTVIKSILEYHGFNVHEHHEVSNDRSDVVDDHPALEEDTPVNSDSIPSSASASPVIPYTSSTTTPQPGTSSTTPTSSLSSDITGRGSASASDSDSESVCLSLHDDSESEDMKNNNQIADNEEEEEEEEEAGNAYLQLRKRNIEEREQLLKELVQEKEAASSEFSKPKKKKQKIYPQPTKVTSQYSLRQARRKNPKYAD